MGKISGQWSVVSGQKSEERYSPLIPHPTSHILKKFLLSLFTILCLTAAPARAVDISDYTAYPPFLPRVTSPNILFLLDYSKSMVRPAYGDCQTIKSSSDCRNTFSQTGIGKINLTGTVTLTQNSNTLTGSGTLFNTELSAGNVIRINNKDYSVSSISSDTSLTFTNYSASTNIPYRGSTESKLTGSRVGFLTGTVSVTSNSINVSGSGTKFSSELKSGDTIFIYGTLYIVDTITSDTALTLTTVSNVTSSNLGVIKGDSYSSTTPYSGYFENGYSGSGSYSDSSAYKYSCTAASNGTCDKDSSGEWNGNWLNWLTATQFDILKKVAIGGDVNPAPEQAAPNTVRSILADGYTFNKAMSYGKYIYGSTEPASLSCTGKIPSSLCKAWPTVTYDWVNTPATGVTTVFGAGLDAADVTGYIGRSAKLPFDFTVEGTTYSAGSTFYIYNTGYFYLSKGLSSTSFYPYYDAYYNTSTSTWESFIIDHNRSSIKTFTIGSAPNRIFVITYEDVINRLDTGRAEPMTFQALLYEGSSHVVYQYKEVRATTAWGGGKNATVSVYHTNWRDTTYSTYRWMYKYWSYNTVSLSNSTAKFMTLHLSFTVTPRSGTTDFQVAAPLNGIKPTDSPPSGLAMSGSSPAGYKVEIDIDENGSCTSEGVGCYYNQDRAKYYDHETVGLLQDFRDGELGGTLGFRLAIEQLNGTTSANMDGGKVVKHFNAKDTTGWASLMTATRSQTPTTNTPLSEALQIAEGYFKQDTTYNMGLTAANSWTNDGTGSTCASTGTNYDPYCFQSAAQRVSCCKSFVLLVSSGNYSNDNRTNIYGDAADSDGQLIANAWRSTDDSGSEGTKANGGWLDNVAYKAHTTDWRSDLEGTQNLTLYVVNTFGEGSGEGTNILKKAAKYGGFDDSLGATTDAYDASVSGNCTPAKGEDDKNCDGNPDTYFEASGGSDLKSKIISAVMDIMKSSASGTSVSVLSTSAGGEGAIYQAYFYPAKTEGTTEERTWPGFLRAFFLDKYENLRDDSGGGSYQNCPGSSCAFSGSTDAKLIMASDRVAQMYLDTSSNEVKVKVFSDADGILPAQSWIDDNSTIVSMDQIASIWEGGKKLALRNKGDRKIYLWLDSDLDGVVDNGDFNSLSGEAMEFTATDANATTLKSYLRAQAGDVDGAGSYNAFTADQEAKYIMKFVRGEAITPTTTSSDNTGVSYRNRCITISGATQEDGCTGSNQRVWALGDIIYSTPTLVSGPGEQYDLLYGDSAYKELRDKYQDRRRMVYVGGNDGMLHAFNGGVYTAGDDCDGTTGTVSESGCFAANPTSGNGWGSAELGDELWAFVPHDNLPHLGWLACNGTSTDPVMCGSSDYTHVYYVDSRPKVTDARIFNNSGGSCGTAASGLVDGQSDACHPGGWGTIMIMSMRLGGGAIDVDINGGGATLSGEKFRSAYYAFDITDPEKKPKLLWRFYDSNLGFTTSYPAIARICDNATNPCTGNQKWYMIVGNGSNNLTGTQASSIRDYGGNSTTLAGRVFVVDLEDGSLDKTLTVESTATTYLGDPLVVDENFDFTSDAIYVGSSIQSTGSSTVSGKVYRIQTNGGFASGWTSSTLFNAGKPVLIPPSVATDSKRNLWVFFGTGRLRNSDDLTNSEQQTFYGIKDACGKKGATCTTTYTTADLANSSASVVTKSTQAVSGVTKPAAYTGSTPTDYASLLTMMRSDTVKGWYVNLDDPATPSERVLSRAAVLGGVVLFTTYIPVSNICSIFGDSRLYALNYETGTAYNKAVIGTTSSSTGIGTSTSTTTGTYVSKAVELGKGMPTAVGIAVGEKVSGFVQKSTGEIIRVEHEPGQSIKSGAASWREKTGSGTSEIETIYKHIIK